MLAGFFKITATPFKFSVFLGSRVFTFTATPGIAHGVRWTRRKILHNLKIFKPYLTYNSFVSELREETKPVPYSLKLQDCNFQLVPSAVERNTNNKLQLFPILDDATYTRHISSARGKCKNQVSHSWILMPITAPGCLPGLAAPKDLRSGQAVRGDQGDGSQPPQLQ